MLTLAPGPDILLVFSESLAKGSKSALMLAAGLVCGLPFHTLVLVLGWGQFIGLYPNLIVVLKICGALYFLYLATQTFNNLKIEDIYSLTDIIEGYRKNNNRIKPTPNNPVSSRSHLYLVFEIYTVLLNLKYWHAIF